MVAEETVPSESVIVAERFIEIMLLVDVKIVNYIIIRRRIRINEYKRNMLILKYCVT